MSVSLRASIASESTLRHFEKRLCSAFSTSPCAMPHHSAPLLQHHNLLSIFEITGPVAQWIRHRPTEPGIAGSSPVGVICCCAHITVASKVRFSDSFHTSRRGLEGNKVCGQPIMFSEVGQGYSRPQKLPFGIEPRAQDLQLTGLR